MSVPTADSLPAQVEQVFTNPFWAPHRLNNDRKLIASSFQYYLSSNGRTYVDRAIFVNYSGVDRLVTLRWVQALSGASAGPGGGKTDASDANLLSALTIKANDTFIFPMKCVLESGDYITAFADNTGAVSLLLLGGLER